MDLFQVRKDFSLKTLNEDDIKESPYLMLEEWIKEAILAQSLEPTAMCLSTVSSLGIPSSRIVLLKELKSNGLVFFTNYQSKKAQEIATNNHVSVNLCWHELERQVRVEGSVFKLDDEASDAYYNMRPEESKIGAWASPQSQIIPNREFLENLLSQYKNKFENRPIDRPKEWGGYIINPSLFEFWQGRKNRLHDRFQYTILENNTFRIDRLAP